MARRGCCDQSESRLSSLLNAIAESRWRRLKSKVWLQTGHGGLAANTYPSELPFCFSAHFLHTDRRTSWRNSRIKCPRWADGQSANHSVNGTFDDWESHLAITGVSISKLPLVVRNNGLGPPAQEGHLWRNAPIHIRSMKERLRPRRILIELRSTSSNLHTVQHPGCQSRQFGAVRHLFRTKPIF